MTLKITTPIGVNGRVFGMYAPFVLLCSFRNNFLMYIYMISAAAADSEQRGMRMN